ncbi:MAG: peptidylprolyl isomerase [Gammaproteobacteria bacterium]|nr:peptidylprolyl isomerase [Gammaproteobacteria bacterium]
MPSEKRDRQHRNREEKRKRLQRARRNALLKRRFIQSIWIAAFVMAVVTLSNLTRGSDATTTTTSTQSSSTTIAEPTTDTTAPSALGPAYEAFRGQQVACGATAPPPARQMQFDAPDDQQIDPAAIVTATVATSCGDIVIHLDPTAAPQTVNSFVFLARQGFFDGTVFHRIVPGFVIQGGDPTAVGTGGPGYTIADEFPPAGFAYDRGVVAMANSGPDSTGSQFFVVLDDTSLQPGFSLLGTVLDGDTTLDAIAAVPVGPSASGENSNPLETVYINTVTINITG